MSPFETKQAFIRLSAVNQEEQRQSKKKKKTTGHFSSQNENTNQNDLKIRKEFHLFRGSKRDSMSRDEVSSNHTRERLQRKTWIAQANKP